VLDFGVSYAEMAEEKSSLVLTVGLLLPMLLCVRRVTQNKDTFSITLVHTPGLQVFCRAATINQLKSINRLLK